MTVNALTNSHAFQPGNQMSVGHGAPTGNVNGIRSGVASSAVRNLKLGLLKDKRIERDCNRFRRLLEQWTLDCHGWIKPSHELAINTATRHEVVCRLAMKYMRDHDDKLSPMEKLHYLSTMAKHSDLRDKAVDRLGLDQSPADAIATLYGPIDGGSNG